MLTQHQQLKPKVVILALGGTIAGHSDDRMDHLNYAPGAYHIDKILDSIYEIREVADITTEQLESFNSSEITVSHWLMLKEKIESYLTEQGYDGVVITHGTNTLEETAYFLHLTVHSTKPVVVVGSQRPFSAIGSDAAINLYQAVRVASSKQSHHKGVLVAMNNEIHSAREVTKSNTYQMQSFQSGQMGALGFADVDGTIQYYRIPSRLHTINSQFSRCTIAHVPDVAIVYSYAGSAGEIIRLITDSNQFQGIVVAAMGGGMLTSKEELALREALQKGMTIVRSSRVGNGRVVNGKLYQNSGFIYSDNLLPQKARILLMLSLMAGKNQEQIQEIFCSH